MSCENVSSRSAAKTTGSETTHIALAWKSCRPAIRFLSNLARATANPRVQCSWSSSKPAPGAKLVDRVVQRLLRVFQTSLTSLDSLSAIECLHYVRYIASSRALTSHPDAVRCTELPLLWLLHNLSAIQETGQHPLKQRSMRPTQLQRPYLRIVNGVESQGSLKKACRTLDLDYGMDRQINSSNPAQMKETFLVFHLRSTT